MYSVKLMVSRIAKKNRVLFEIDTNIAQKSAIQKSASHEQNCVNLRRYRYTILKKLSAKTYIKKSCNLSCHNNSERCAATQKFPKRLLFEMHRQEREQKNHKFRKCIITQLFPDGSSLNAKTGVRKKN